MGILIEIRVGTGGKDSSLWIQDQLKIYHKYAMRSGL